MRCRGGLLARTWREPHSSGIGRSPPPRKSTFVGIIRWRRICRIRGRKVIHIRTSHNGIPWDGRVMEAQVAGPPGRLTIKLTCVSNLFKLLRALAWVNNTTPPEFQLNITGKQDVDWGPPDQVMKKYVSKVMTRLRSPVVAALPIRKTTPELPDLDGHRHPRRLAEHRARVTGRHDRVGCPVHSTRRTVQADSRDLRDRLVHQLVDAGRRETVTARFQHAHAGDCCNR